MALAGVELVTPIIEPDALAARPTPRILSS